MTEENVEYIHERP